MASTVHYAPPPPPSTGHALSRPHAGADDEGSDSESVAESSCPGSYARRPTESGFLGGDCDEDDNDGCSSCVEGGELGCYEEAEDDDEEVSTARVWWKKRLAGAAGSGGAQQQEVTEVEDPERAAARQAEDRKFWEDCLGTGYP